MLKLLKVKGYDVKTPKVGDYEITDPNAKWDNAGIDLFVPKLNEQFEKDFKKYNPYLNIDEDTDGNKIIRLGAGKNAIIPSGWYTKFPESQMLMVANKSGVANKKHLSFAAHIIDSSYQGNLLISVFNYGSDWTVIPLDEKLVQVIQVPVLLGAEIVPEDTDKDVFFVEKSERGEGALGSTGLK